MSIFLCENYIGLRVYCLKKNSRKPTMTSYDCDQWYKLRDCMENIVVVAVVGFFPCF